MQHLLVLAELPREFLDAVFVEKSFFLRRLSAFVGQIDLETRIEKSELAQTRRQALKLEFRCDREDRRIRQKRDERSGCLLAFDFADDFKLFGRFTLGEGHVVNLAV